MLSVLFVLFKMNLLPSTYAAEISLPVVFTVQEAREFGVQTLVAFFLYDFNAA